MIAKISAPLNVKGVQTVGRKTSWAKDVWANYFLGDRRLGDNSHFKKDVSTKDGWRQRPKQFASQHSTLVRNSVVRATIKVNGMGNGTSAFYSRQYFIQY